MYALCVTFVYNVYSLSIIIWRGTHFATSVQLPYVMPCFIPYFKECSLYICVSGTCKAALSLPVLNAEAQEHDVKAARWKWSQAV